MSIPGKIVLEDGRCFDGVSVGAVGTRVGELVFNTAMSGYQETITDPSYAGQIISFTYPHIGNTGINFEDYESKQIWAAAVIMNQCGPASSWRSQQSLPEFLREQDTVALAGIDTRALTLHLREHGALKACISTEDLSVASMQQQAQEFAGLQGANLASEVTCDAAYEWTEGAFQLGSGYKQYAAEDLSSTIVVIDFGVKRAILRYLVDFCQAKLIVVPATTDADTILNYQADGIFLSNGPGDPEACTGAIATIKTLLNSKTPIFGICLGQQLLALASGAKAQKMKFGHHGINHPVLDKATGRVAITSQNHGFAIDANSLPQNMAATHISLFDNSLQGLRRTDVPAFGFQGHPESSPGPHDIRTMFADFAQLINE